MTHGPMAHGLLGPSLHGHMGFYDSLVMIMTNTTTITIITFITSTTTRDQDK